MKKQIILIAVVFAVAVAVGITAIIISNNGKTQWEYEGDSFYILTDEVEALLSDESVKGSLTFGGCNPNNDDMERVYKFMQAFERASEGRISASYTSSGDKAVTVAVSGGSKKIEYDAFYRRKDDGTPYAFDGENLIAGAICSLAGKDEVNVPLRALKGFDTDGDTVLVDGRPFMYPNITRSDVSSLTVKNSYGTFKVYREAATQQFFFEGAEYVNYSQDMFSKLIVNATYMLSNGKVTDPLDFAEYGLTEDKATCTVLVVTLTGDSHKIIIGDKTASGSEYYARYVGKDFVYRLSASDLEESLLLPSTDYFTPLLVYPLTETTDIQKITSASISFVRDGLTINASQFRLAELSPNAKTFGDITTDELIVDNNFFTGEYSGWKDGSVFGAFSTNDGEECFVQLTMTNYALNGDYSVKFGLLRDESSGAYLPKSVGIGFSTDGGKNFTRADATVKPEHNNQECKTYTLSFKADEPVQYIRLYFSMKKDVYTVIDEIRAYGDGEDCQPADALVGNWKVTEPAEYIPEGKNFIYPDSNNFTTTFLSSLGTLVGDSVVESGLATDVYDSSTINQTMLKKYGLDDPDIIASYVFNGWTSTVYFKRDKEDSTKYYAYSTEDFHDDVKKDYYMTTGIIAVVTTTTAEWLTWDPVDFLDHNLLSMYIDDIHRFTLSFGGQDYAFDLIDTDSDDKIDTVKIDGKTVDTKNFRYLYVSLIGITLKGEYSAADDPPAEILRVKIDGDTKSPEIVFYRVSATKAYYTVDGQGKYYVLVDRVNTVKRNVGLLLAGESVPR